MRLANLSGSPAQNFVVVDDKGRIGWTILGRIPRGFRGPAAQFVGRRLASLGRISHSGRIPANPGSRRRPAVDGERPRSQQQLLDTLGDGGYDLGGAGPTDPRRSAEHRAHNGSRYAAFGSTIGPCFSRWQELLLDTLTPEAVAADPRAQLREICGKLGRARRDRFGRFRTCAAFPPGADGEAFGRPDQPLQEIG